MSASREVIQQQSIILYYLRCGLDGNVIAACNSVSGSAANDPFIQFWKAFALSRQGKLNEAQSILYKLTNVTQLQLAACLLLRDILGTKDVKSLHCYNINCVCDKYIYS